MSLHVERSAGEIDSKVGQTKATVGIDVYNGECAL